jgi:hypothetical protein
VNAPASSRLSQRRWLLASLVDPAAALLVAALTLVSFKAALDIYQASGVEGLGGARTPTTVALGGSVGIVAFALLLRQRGVPQKALLRTIAFTGASVAVMISIPSGGISALAALALLGGWAWLMGDLALSRLTPHDLSLRAWERATLATALGLGLLSMAVLVLALCGAISGLSLAILLALGLGGGLLGRLRRSKAGPVAKPEPAPPPADAIDLCAFALITAALVLLLGASLAPQVTYDALHYHLTMPATILREGRFVERPDIIQSYFPLGLEMVFVPAMWLRGEVAANLMNWLLLPLTAAIVWSAAGRLVGRPAGAIAACLAAFSPLIFQAAYTDSADLAMSLYVACCLWCLSVPGIRPLRLRFLAGAFAGFAVSFKLVAGYYVVPLALLALGQELLLTPLWRGRLRGLAAFGVGAFAFGSPWLIVRWVQTGNPVFPVLNNVFRSPKWPPVNERFDLNQFGIGKAPWDLLRGLWELSVRPYEFGQGMPPWSVGIVVLLGVSVLAALAARSRFSSGLLAWTLAALACTAVWLLVSQYHRYGMPAFLLLSLPAAYLATRGLRLLTADAVGATGAAVCLVTWFAAGSITGMASLSYLPKGYPTDFLTGSQSVDAYRAAAHRNYPALRYLDSQLKGTSDIAAITGNPWNFYVTNQMYGVASSRFRSIGEPPMAPGVRAKALLDAHIRWIVVSLDTQIPPWFRQNILDPAFADRYLRPEFVDRPTTVYRVILPTP